MTRTLAGGAAVVSAGVLPFLVGMPAASAETKSDTQELNYEFSNNNGDDIVCHIRVHSELTRPTSDPTFDSLTETEVSNGPECAANLEIRATYTNQDGRSRTIIANGAGSYLGLRNDDVVSGYSAHHQVTFIDCVNFCTTPFDTHPK
jgi:hypothetical protein